MGWMLLDGPLAPWLLSLPQTLLEMNEWLVKLSAGATESSEKNSGECYSEESDQEQEEQVEALRHLFSEQLTTDSVDGDVPPPRSTSSPCRTTVLAPAPASIGTSESSEAPATGRTETPPPPPPDRVGGAQEGPPQDGTCDDMERLYVHLQQMRLFPIGQPQPSRTSFFRRCKNDNMNDKLHLVRTLNSTLKSKEADLLALEQVLEDPTLTVLKYHHQWKVCNVLVLQEITHRKGPGGGSRELAVRPPRPACVAETSV